MVKTTSVGGGNRSEATVHGDYGSQIQGTRPAPGGLTEAVIGIVFRTYDGLGNFSQVANVKGSITGTVPDSEGFGTYEVHPDCTGIIRFQPGPGIVIEERLVIVDSGREIRTAVMVPTAVMITRYSTGSTGAEPGPWHWPARHRWWSAGHRQ